MNGFLHQSIHHTLHQAVEWVQNSPPLFNRSASPLFLDSPLPTGITPVMPERKQLELLASLVNRKGNPLLGIFYETLWQFLLSQLPDSQVIASNLQVKGERNSQSATLGEYDLIYQLRNQFIHRELAVKFYLGIPDETGNANGAPWRNWVGPGLKDRLDRKMDRLLHHQALLSDTNEGQESLLKLGIEQPVQKETLIQGRLFYPLYPMNAEESQAVQLTDVIESDTESKTQNHVHRLCQPPELSNPEHLKGYWLTQSQFLLSTRLTNKMNYQIPHKIQWLNREPYGKRLNHDELIPQLTQQKRPLYIRAIHNELERGLNVFIVPDDWTGHAIKVTQELL
ncbi:DUF1853 family protein [Endozoicomonas sp.]|uniref:DUF1853 family protein n=1 Tax=Endozoicomonas sp. TaxID=1892382 RepID=UPI003AF49FCC